MKFPYGLSDFYQVVSEGYFYADRTAHIRALEEAGKLLLFLRPRRFGKSLLLSMLENYYDIARADQFTRIFGHLAIGADPTLLHNRYFVMKWDFSVVSTYGPLEKINQTLNDHINSQIDNFASRYRSWLSQPVSIRKDNAAVSFDSLLTAVQQSSHSLYLLIDEYDTFANQVLMAGGSVARKRYQELVEGEGIFKTIFRVIKSATSGRGLERIFIVGVSPVVLSDVSSGYNVSGSLYLRPTFNDLCGFTEAEVADALRQVVQERGLPEEKVAEAMDIMAAFYNGYSFSYDSAPTLYNPTLALYFLDYLKQEGAYPRQLFDSNLEMDRVKIEYIARLPHGEQLVLAALQEQPPVTVAQLADRFGVERMLRASARDTTFMASLLYYFGVLTLTQERSEDGEAVLRIPNQVARKLYAERYLEMLLPDVSDLEEGRSVARKLYQHGDMQPLCDFIEQRYLRVYDNRDYRWANELTLKTLFLTLLFNNTFYIIDSEPALQRSYADLLMRRRPEMRQFQLLDVLIEFEYVSLSDAGLSGEQARALTAEAVMALPTVQEKLTDAQAQLRRYAAILHEKYGEILRLRCYAVVGLGFERLVWLEEPVSPSSSGNFLL
jgi:hypothetical protein